MSGGERVVTIGRSADCDIVLSDDTVSALHAELRLMAGGELFLTDCNSSNGTVKVVDGQEVPIHQESVSRHDRLRFGDYEIAVSELVSRAGAGAAPPVPAFPVPPPVPAFPVPPPVQVAPEPERPLSPEVALKLASRSRRLGAVLLNFLFWLPAHLFHRCGREDQS